MLLSQGGRMPQCLKETSVDGNDECSLDQLANNLTKDTGISQSVLPQVFYPYTARSVLINSL